MFLDEGAVGVQRDAAACLLTSTDASGAVLRARWSSIDEFHPSLLMVLVDFLFGGGKRVVNHYIGSYDLLALFGNNGFALLFQPDRHRVNEPYVKVVLIHLAVFPPSVIFPRSLAERFGAFSKISKKPDRHLYVCAGATDAHFAVAARQLVSITEAVLANFCKQSLSPCRDVSRRRNPHVFGDDFIGSQALGFSNLMLLDLVLCKQSRNHRGGVLGFFFGGTVLNGDLKHASDARCDFLFVVLAHALCSTSHDDFMQKKRGKGVMENNYNKTT